MSAATRARVLQSLPISSCSDRPLFSSAGVDNYGHLLCSYGAAILLWKIRVVDNSMRPLRNESKPVPADVCTYEA
eukprot:1160271-Pelagomonas_calceolata.AAC.9